MKKLLIFTSLISFLAAANAVAKTEGDYAGLSVIDTKGGSFGKNFGENASAGVDYKHAFNFGNFFVAPGLFYDVNSKSQNYANTAYQQNLNTRYSYGAKVNLGYDITNKFAPFVTIGESLTRVSQSANNLGSQSFSKKNSTNSGMVLGTGLKYSLCENVDVNASYEMVQYRLANNLNSIIDGTDKIHPSYKIFRVGATYRF